MVPPDGNARHHHRVWSLTTICGTSGKYVLGLINNDGNANNNDRKMNKEAINAMGKNRTRRSEGVEKVLFDLPHFARFPVYAGALWTQTTQFFFKCLIKDFAFFFVLPLRNHVIKCQNDDLIFAKNWFPKHKISEKLAWYCISNLR